MRLILLSAAIASVIVGLFLLRGPSGLILVILGVVALVLIGVHALVSRASNTTAPVSRPPSPS